MLRDSACPRRPPEAMLAFCFHRLPAATSTSTPTLHPGGWGSRGPGSSNVRCDIFFWRVGRMDGLTMLSKGRWTESPPGVASEIFAAYCRGLRFRRVLKHMSMSRLPSLLIAMLSCFSLSACLFRPLGQSSASSLLLSLSPPARRRPECSWRSGPVLVA